MSNSNDAPRPNPPGCICRYQHPSNPQCRAVIEPAAQNVDVDYYINGMCVTPGQFAAAGGDTVENLRSRIAELEREVEGNLRTYDSLSLESQRIEKKQLAEIKEMGVVIAELKAERDRLRDRLRLIAYFYDSGGNGKLNTALLDMGVKFADEEPTAMKMCKLAEAALKESQ